MADINRSDVEVDFKAYLATPFFSQLKSRFTTHNFKVSRISTPPTSKADAVASLKCQRFPPVTHK